MDKRLKVGWFSFTCCEDSTIMLTELLNTRYKEWLKRIEFVHARIFRRDDTKELREMDVAFVEGAISSDKQKEKLLRIRGKAKVLVAIGSCAALGSPSNQRNFFNRENLEEISPILNRFLYLDKVLKVSDVVKVDKTVHGCPMSELLFVKLIEELIDPTKSEAPNPKSETIPNI